MEMRAMVEAYASPRRLRLDSDSDLSTGCTECCGNVDYSTFANCGIFLFLAPCEVSPQAIHSLLRRARRGSRTKQHREVVRDGPQGPERKVDRGCGRNRDRLGEFFWSNPALPRRRSRLDYDRRDAPAASTEHRPRRHRRSVGRRPRGVHLLRPDRSRSQRRDGDRPSARLVRGDLAVRAAARRGSPCPAAPALLSARLRRPPAVMAGREREQQLARELAAELSDEPLPRGNGLRIEALEVCDEEPHPPLRPGLGEDCHPSSYIGGPTPLA